MPDVNLEIGRATTTARVWSNGEEYDDQRCEVEVSNEDGGGPSMGVSVDGRGWLIQFQFSREAALDMGEAFLRAARP